MKTLSKLTATALALVCSTALFSTVTADDAKKAGANIGFEFLTAAIDGEKDNPTKDFMKKYHKAPQGTDNIVKKATLGKATPEELKGIAAGYKAMKSAKPPRGEMASWTEKTSKASAAADALLKGDAGAADRFKEAINCKACHSEHKPN